MKTLVADIYDTNLKSYLHSKHCLYLSPKYYTCNSNYQSYNSVHDCGASGVSQKEAGGVD